MRALRRLRNDEPAELVEHLGELRMRLFIALGAVAAGFVVAFIFHGALLDLLNRPLPAAHQRPVTFGVAEPFVTSMKVSLFVGFLAALPIVMWQLWAFVAPAFKANVQRVVGALTGGAAALAVAGLAFGYLIALPSALEFLTSFDDTHYRIEIRAQDYYSFALTVLLAVTLVFELPIFLLGLVQVGALSAAKLRRNRRVGIVAVVALAVALPGVDPVTTMIEALPLLVLFEASIWVAVLLERRALRTSASTVMNRP